MIIPIVLGMLISYVLKPTVAWMGRWRVPRPLAAAVVLLLLVASSGWLLYSLRSQASALVDQLPQAAKRLRQLVENERPTTASAIQQVQKGATELEKAANAAAPPRRRRACSACRWKRPPSTSATT
jgi:predicted PurR-regulated permease PerM